MAGENRGGAPESSKWKKIAMGLGLIGALGGAVESGRLNVKSAGATSESKSSADEEEGEGDGEEKKAEAPRGYSNSGSIGGENSINVTSQEEKKGSPETDMTGVNLEIVKRLLNADEDRYDVVLRKSVDDNLYCDIFLKKTKDGQAEGDTGLKIIINKDGTFNVSNDVSNISQYVAPKKVDNTEAIVDEIRGRVEFIDDLEEYKKNNYTAEDLAARAKEHGIEANLTSLPTNNAEKVSYEDILKDVGKTIPNDMKKRIDEAGVKKDNP
jgi:hypothetical protein